jgi:hypothetical protein
MNKKLITFSLWGENPKYTIGALKNVELAKIIYPNWICRFYVGKSVPKEILIHLKSNENVEIVEMDENGNWSGMFWRFNPASEDDVDIMISRDCDSRLSQREKSAVDEWINSDKGFHIMRDHPYHGVEILGGMWGVKKGVLPEMKKFIDEFIKGEFWQVDQNFLKEKIYPLIFNNSMVHDEFHNYESFKKKFPLERLNKEFVGDVFDENDNRHPEYLKLIK